MKKAGFLTKIAMAISVSLAFTFTLSFADTIHLKDGSKIEDAAITEIGDSDVKYKIGQRAVIYIAKKSDIAAIVYEDGTKEEFASKSNIELDDNKDEELPQPKKIDKKQKQEKIEDAEEADKRIRFGVRGNVGMASTFAEIELISGGSVAVDGNISGGLGAFAIIPLASIYFVPEISLQYREPIKDFYGMDLKEVAIDIPLLFRFRYRKENLVYLGVGPLLGYLLSSYYYIGNEEYLNENREKLDYGLATELGFRINDNFSIDIRLLMSFASIGFSEFLEIGGDSVTLSQFQIGLNYLF